MILTKGGKLSKYNDRDLFLCSKGLVTLLYGNGYGGIFLPHVSVVSPEGGVSTCAVSDLIKVIIIENTRLARKMFPNVINYDGFLVVEE
jgi:hypothetical protein